jgi:hypothetical protein
MVEVKGLHPTTINIYLGYVRSIDFLNSTIILDCWLTYSSRSGFTIITNFVNHSVLELSSEREWKIHGCEYHT